MTGYPVVAAGVEWLELDGQVLVLQDELIHLLSGSAAQIWQELTGDTAVDDVARGLAARHDAAAGVHDDVHAFVADLVERGLVVLAAEPVGSGLRIPPHVAWTRDGAVVALVDLRTGDRRALSVSGSRVWELVSLRLTKAELLAQLAQEFPDAPPRLETETLALLDELVDRGLLVRTAESIRARQ